MRIRREFWELFTKRFRTLQSKPFCTSKNIEKPRSPTSKDNGGSSNEVGHVNGPSSLSRQDAYKQLDNLDFMTAAKILFTTPPKKKEFGIDFHLVQFFFACMPSLAVYLVAMYARSEMRRMEAEAEVKRKAEEEAKAKEMELKAAEEKEAPPDPHLMEVKARLDRLEKNVKEIADLSKKKPTDERGSAPADAGGNKQQTTKEVKNIDSSNDVGSSSTESNSHKQVFRGSTSMPNTDTPQENPKSS